MSDSIVLMKHIGIKSEDELFALMRNRIDNVYTI